MKHFRVRINGEFSSWFGVLSGIPRGSILGPLLFIIYINDLLEVRNSLLTKTNVYADDTKMSGVFTIHATDICYSQILIDSYSDSESVTQLCARLRITDVMLLIVWYHDPV